MNRVERAGDHLAGSGAMVLFGQPVLEQFRVREDDAQMVVQRVKKAGQVKVCP